MVYTTVSFPDPYCGRDPEPHGELLGVTKPKQLYVGRVRSATVVSSKIDASMVRKKLCVTAVYGCWHPEVVGSSKITTAVYSNSSAIHNKLVNAKHS